MRWLYCIVHSNTEALKQDVDKCREAGCDAVLFKPFQPRELIDLLTQCAHKAAAVQAQEQAQAQAHAHAQAQAQASRAASAAGSASGAASPADFEAWTPPPAHADGAPAVVSPTPAS